MKSSRSRLGARVVMSPSELHHRVVQLLNGDVLRAVKPAVLIRLLAALLSLAACNPSPAYAWADEGHRVVALIAQRYLQPAVRTKVEALLATDDSGLLADTS